MAFSIISEPGNFQPAYNDLTFRVYEGTLYSSTNFKYNFYTYVNGTLVNTTKLYPRPDGYCNFNPSSIIQQYVSRKFQPTLAAYTEADATEVVKYKVVMKYEYETGGTLTEYSGNTGTEKYAWNAVASWTDAQSISTYIAKFNPSLTTLGEALNFVYKGTSADKGIELNINDKRTFSFLRRTTAGTASPVFFKVYVYCRDGNTKQYTLNLPAASATPVSYIFHMPIGISQLNAITWSGRAIPVGKSNSINFTEDYAMRIQVLDIDSEELSENYYFTFTEGSCKYDHYTVAYQSPNGGYGYVNFNCKHFKQVVNEKTVYDKILPYNYTSANRVSTVYGNISNEQITLNTDWIKEQDIITEIKDMIQSPELWLIDKNNVVTPVFIDKVTFSENYIAQDKLSSYTLTFSEAFRKNTIR